MSQWLEGLLEKLGWRQRSWSHGESKVLLCLVGWVVVFAPSQSVCPIFWAESCSKLQDLRFRQASRDPGRPWARPPEAWATALLPSFPAIQSSHSIPPSLQPLCFNLYFTRYSRPLSPVME